MFNRILQIFKRRSSGFWSRYRWYFIICVLALLCDTVSTIYFMSSHGPDGYKLEFHPVFRLAAEFCGPVIGPLLGFLGKVIAALLVGIYLRKWSRWFFLTVIILSFWAAWYNIWGIKLGYYPNIFNLLPWL